MPKQTIVNCPECGKVWSQEEIDLDECDTCGYPDNTLFEEIESDD